MGLSLANEVLLDPVVGLESRILCFISLDPFLSAKPDKSVRGAELCIGLPPECIAAAKPRQTVVNEAVAILLEGVLLSEPLSVSVYATHSSTPENVPPH